MTTIFMAKKDDKPLGFYSTYPLVASVSSDVVEMGLPIIEGASKGCVFYADAVYSLFSMNNGIPKETNVIIGPFISRSANVALNDLHTEVDRRRLSGCELDHFLCFELDRFYGEPLVEEPMIYNDSTAPRYTCHGDCKNDPLIKKTWKMLSEGKTWDLDHLTLNQLIQELYIYKPEIDFHNRYYSFTTNLVIRSIVEMCMNNISLPILASSVRSDALERVSLSKVGYLAFMNDSAANAACSDNDFQPPLTKDMIQNWELNEVFKYFIEDEEYGIYFVQSLEENRCLFVNRTLIRAAYRAYLIQQCAEAKEDRFELTLSDSEKALLDSPQWWMVWNSLFEAR